MLLLILEKEIIFSSNVIAHLLSRFLFIFAICIPFDIRDVKYDNIKLKTIPIVFGVSRSKLISFISLLFVIIISTFQYWNNKLSIGFFVAISLSCIVSSIFIEKSNGKKSDFYFSFWVESLSILLYLFLVISITLF
jgi:4-hydroxybenzoate polyprenyltransferase